MMTTKMGERDSTEEIAKAFKLFDDDNTGKINFKNLKRVAKELGENMTDDELQVNILVTEALAPAMQAQSNQACLIEMQQGRSVLNRHCL